MERQMPGINQKITKLEEIVTALQVNHWILTFHCAVHDSRSVDNPTG